MDLIMDRRGCPFREAEGWCKGHREDASDVGNYRITTIAETVKGKDGKTYFLEFDFQSGYRFRDKRNGRWLSKPVRDAEYADFLHIDTEFTENNMSKRNLLLENDINSKHFKYTLQGVLDAVNYICGEHRYDKIVFVD